MKALLWNIRGLGNAARVRQFKDLMGRHRFDVVGVQETIKKDFATQELEGLSGGGDFSWHWIPARGHSGRILVGVRTTNLEVESWENGDYFVGATIRHRKTNIRYDMLTVYGPADHNWSLDFLEELDNRCRDRLLPILIGGDFNLIRGADDKSNGVVDQKLVDAFNNFIEKLSLREMHRGGPRFTWTNKQVDPTQSNLDRVIVSTDWETKFPLSNLTTLTRIGSDHCTLMLDTGEGAGTHKERQFFFEKQWCHTEGFLQLVDNKWGEVRAKCPEEAYSLDRWHGGGGSALRNFLKGWRRNIRGDYKKERDELMRQIQDIDARRDQ
jgi:exonuclease III